MFNLLMLVYVVVPNYGLARELTVDCPPGYLIQGMSSYERRYCMKLSIMEHNVKLVSFAEHKEVDHTRSAGSWYVHCVPGTQPNAIP